MGAAGLGGTGMARGGTWQRDYPKADRQFLIALKRLTRIQGRATEQVVNLDSDDIFNYPCVYAVMVQTWSFNGRRGEAAAGVSAEGRIPDGGRLPWDGGLGELYERDAAGVSGPSGGGPE